MTVLPQAKHAQTPKRFRQIDNEQYDSHTDPWTAYVRILYHHHLNVNQSFDCHVDCQIHQQNHLHLFYSSYLAHESRSVLANLSLVMEFLENIFTNFIFEKYISHEALVTGSYSYQ